MASVGRRTRSAPRVAPTFRRARRQRAAGGGPARLRRGARASVGRREDRLRQRSVGAEETVESARVGFASAARIANLLEAEQPAAKPREPLAGGVADRAPRLPSGTAAAVAPPRLSRAPRPWAPPGRATRGQRIRAGRPTCGPPAPTRPGRRRARGTAPNRESSGTTRGSRCLPRACR